MWDYTGRFGLIFINLIITSILSRILSPTDYGVLGLVMAVSGIASIFMDFGFGAAIVQQKELRNIQLSTVFYIGLGLSLAIYTILFLASPLVSRFYQAPELTNLLRVSTLGFIANGLNLVPNALITKRMMFKAQSLRNLILTGVIGAAAIFLALNGWGVWALVLQMLFSAVAGVLVNYWLTRWRPGLAFNWPAVKGMFDYGKYLFLSGALDSVFTKLDSLIIGKAMRISDVGFLSRAKGLENMIQGVASSSLIGVLFPYFAKVQDDPKELRETFDRFFVLISVLIFLMTGLAYINAPWIFHLLFGSQWLISADYYRIIALSAFVYPLSALILSVVRATGHSGDFFRAELWKKLVIFPSFFFIFWKMEAFLYATVVAYMIALLINLYFLRNSLKAFSWHHLPALGKQFILLSLFLLSFHLLWDYLTGLMDSWVAYGLFNILYVLYFFLSNQLLLPREFELSKKEGLALVKRII